MPNGKSRYHTTVGKNPHRWNRTHHNQLQEKRAAFHRAVKQHMLKEGTIENKTPFIWEWLYGEEFGTVVGFTKSEARSQVKQALNISKKKPLPHSVQIEKVEFDESPE